MARLSLRDKLSYSTILEETEVQLLLQCIKRSQHRWFGYMIRMPHSHLPLEDFQAYPNEKIPL